MVDEEVLDLGQTLAELAKCKYTWMKLQRTHKYQCVGEDDALDTHTHTHTHT